MWLQILNENESTDTLVPAFQRLSPHVGADWLHIIHVLTVPPGVSSPPQKSATLPIVPYLHRHQMVQVSIVFQLSPGSRGTVTYALFQLNFTA